MFNFIDLAGGSALDQYVNMTGKRGHANPLSPPLILPIHHPSFKCLHFVDHSTPLPSQSRSPLSFPRRTTNFQMYPELDLTIPNSIGLRATRTMMATF